LSTSRPPSKTLKSFKYGRAAPVTDAPDFALPLRELLLDPASNKSKTGDPLLVLEGQ
jgi:hypothetical protein